MRPDPTRARDASPADRSTADRPTAGASRREFVLPWLAVGAWSLVILWLGTGAFSADGTSRIVGPLLDFLFPGLDAATKSIVHAAIRKLAHFGEYAVLGALALHAGVRSGAGTGRAALLAIGLCIAVAAADEGGQSLRIARTGSPRDVALDTAGGGFGVSIATGLRLLLARRRSRRARTGSRAG